MNVALVIEGPCQPRPGLYRSAVVTRIWWLWFAVKIIHVSEYEYATTSYRWEGSC